MWIARILLCCLPIWTAAPAEIAKLPEPYQSLVDLAAGAPPEFAADALLRIVEKGRPADEDARRGLIEEAFRSAAAANGSRHAAA
ncbi:MAG: hypothetical protein ABSH31_22380 [Bryobacteraceae bacterium]|jgi:hypothetical protein